MVGPLVMRALGVALLCVVGPTFGAVAQDDPRVAIPTLGGGPATFDPNMPSYRFAEHVKREPGELVKLDKGIVGLTGALYPNVVFALWDEYQAYATCSESIPLTCDVALFDYADSEIRTYVLPFEAANDRTYLSALVDPVSPASRKTPPIGTATKAVKDTHTPSSGFSTYLRYGPPKVRALEPGVIAVEVPKFDYPNSIYASGAGFEAHGICTERKTIYCTMDVFDHEAQQITTYLIDLDDAEKLETYVNLVQH